MTEYKSLNDVPLTTKIVSDATGDLWYRKDGGWCCVDRDWQNREVIKHFGPFYEGFADYGPYVPYTLEDLK